MSRTQPLLKAIVVRPKTDALRHYLELEAECKNATPLAGHLNSAPSTEDAGPAGGAAELNNTLRDIALSRK